MYLARGVVQLRGTKTAGPARVVPIVGGRRPLIEHALRYAEGTEGARFRPGATCAGLHETCTRAGIEAVSPNDQRRICATWLRQAEVEPDLIGAMLGHTDARMVEWAGRRPEIWRG